MKENCLVSRVTPYFALGFVDVLDCMCIGVYIVSMSSREIIKRLKKDGWELVAVTGSHHKFKHPEKTGYVTVIHPNHDFATATLRSVYRQAGWEWR